MCGSAFSNTLLLVEFLSSFNEIRGRIRNGRISIHHISILCATCSDCYLFVDYRHLGEYFIISVFQRPFKRFAHRRIGADEYHAYFIFLPYHLFVKNTFYHSSGFPFSLSFPGNYPHSFNGGSIEITNYKKLDIVTQVWDCRLFG